MTQNNNSTPITKYNIKEVINDTYFNKVKDNTICKLCKNILKEPMQCSECKEYYCYDCIISGNNNDYSILKCFNLCKNSNFLYEMNLRTNVLSLLRFTCLKGCQKSIGYNDYLVHINNCKGELNKEETVENYALNNMSIMAEYSKMLSNLNNEIARLNNIIRYYLPEDNYKHKKESLLNSKHANTNNESVASVNNTQETQISKYYI